MWRATIELPVTQKDQYQHIAIPGKAGIMLTGWVVIEEVRSLRVLSAPLAVLVAPLSRREVRIKGRS